MRNVILVWSSEVAIEAGTLGLSEVVFPIYFMNVPRHGQFAQDLPAPVLSPINPNGSQDDRQRNS